MTGINVYTTTEEGTVEGWVGSFYSMTAAQNWVDEQTAGFYTIDENEYDGSPYYLRDEMEWSNGDSSAGDDAGDQSGAGSDGGESSDLGGQM